MLNQVSHRVVGVLRRVLTRSGGIAYDAPGFGRAGDLALRHGGAAETLLGHATRRAPRALILPVALLGFAVPADAGPIPPDDGMTWCTVGDPGNRAPLASEIQPIPYGRTPYAGRVDYSYRITKTEVTNIVWLEFIRAISVHLPSTSVPSVTGYGIEYRQGQWRVVPGGENRPVAGIHWFAAAWFVNWLHNEKRAAWQDFSTGVYDVSSAQYVPGTGWVGFSTSRSSDARFWLPTPDEWTKATFWDPNKYGPGQGGYWLYPNRSDVPPVYAIPSLGGTSNAGTDVFMNVGQYPGALSPWGLLDTSGGVREWMGTLGMEFGQGLVPFAGSGHDSFPPWNSLVDPLGNSVDTTGPLTSFAGLRLAALVPNQSTLGFVGPFLVYLSRRRTRHADSSGNTRTRIESSSRISCEWGSHGCPE